MNPKQRKERAAKVKKCQKLARKIRNAWHKPAVGLTMRFWEPEDNIPQRRMHFLPGFAATAPVCSPAAHSCLACEAGIPRKAIPYPVYKVNVEEVERRNAALLEKRPYEAQGNDAKF